MRKLFLFIVLLVVSQLKAQLPPVAQALYNQFYSTNTVIAQNCITNGAQVKASADGKTFYLQWFPAGSTPSTTPLMVSLHGSGANAFLAMDKWINSLTTHSVGIIAYQWYLGASAFPNDYFGDTTLYTYIDTALKRIKYPANKAMFHGFSRGSARFYAIQYIDVMPSVGKNYFCSITSNAGKPDSLYPFYQGVNSASLHTFCAGKRWAMYCGAADPNPARDGCPGMNSAKNNWVTANGGTVGLFIQDPVLGHSGLMDTQTLQDSVLEYYLPCFTSVSVNELKTEQRTLLVFPNPASTQLSFDSEHFIGEIIFIYDNLGISRIEVKIKTRKTNIDISELPKGIYFLKTSSGSSKFIKE